MEKTNSKYNDQEYQNKHKYMWQAFHILLKENKIYREAIEIIKKITDNEDNETVINVPKLVNEIADKALNKVKFAEFEELIASYRDAIKKGNLEKIKILNEENTGRFLLHFKKKLYIFNKIVMHAITNNWLVLYENTEGITWLRTFDEMFDTNERYGDQRYRFIFVSNEFANIEGQ